MHMVSEKDLNSAELETVQVSKAPVVVITTNGEKRGFVRDSEAPRRCSGSALAWKLCEEHGYFYEWTGGQLPHLVKNGRRVRSNT